MVRPFLAKGEKPLCWVGSAKRDLLSFPGAVIEAMGVALSVAQFGATHPKAKPWKGEGPGIFEVMEDHFGDTFALCIPSGLLALSMFFMHSRRNRQPEGKRRRQMLKRSGSG